MRLIFLWTHSFLYILQLPYFWMNNCRLIYECRTFIYLLGNVINNEGIIIPRTICMAKSTLNNIGTVLSKRDLYKISENHFRESTIHQSVCGLDSVDRTRIANNTPMWIMELFRFLSKKYQLSIQGVFIVIFMRILHKNPNWSQQPVRLWHPQL